MRNKSICTVTTIGGTMLNFVLPSMIEMRNKGWNIVLIAHFDEAQLEKIPKEIKCYNVPMERSFNPFVAIKCFFKILKIIRKERVSLIQYGTTHAALYSSIAAWMVRIPVRIHLQWGIYNYDEMGISGSFYKLVEKITCKCSTDIRPVSQKNLEIAENIGLFKKGKGKVLGEGGTVGVDITQYQLENKIAFKKDIRTKYSIGYNDYVYGFIGRISRDKGNNELFGAFKKLLDNNCSNIKLMLLGNIESSLNKELLEWAKSNSNVIFTGSMPHNVIPHYLSSFDVLVHPTYREGFGMVLQEAMAMEIPIITTDIPGPSEVIEDGVSGVLVLSQDEDSLYHAMFDFYLSKEKYVQYGINGRKRVEKYFVRNIMIQNIIDDKEMLYHNYINR